MEFQGGILKYFHPILYPVFIMLLPIRTPTTLVVTLGFILGISVDYFYASLGIHASATVFIAFSRSLLLNLMEPRGGYNVNYSPTRRRLGMSWFLRYAAFMLGIHLLFYFSVEAFTFVYIDRILLNFLFSFILSFALLVLYVLLFNPKD
jgi:hypothetical protein